MVATRRQVRVVASPAPEESKPAQTRYTLQDVASHSSPADCWLIIRRKVYDVTPWIRRHPGGELLLVKAGRDCTQLFDSYHPLSARLVLDRLYIGELDVAPGEEMEVVEYEDDLAEGQFYQVLKRRVEKYFRGNEINPRVSLSMIVKSWVILGTLAMSFYVAFFGTTSFLASMAAAVLLGLAMAEVGVSIQHDANHGAYMPRTWWSALMAATLDAVGASSYMWRQQHVVGHHAYTNLDKIDPDIRTTDTDVRSVTPHHGWHPYHSHQHVYLALLYGLLAMKSVLVDDFTALAEGVIGSVRVKPLTRGEAAVLWGGKALYAAWFLALPALYSQHSWGALAALWLTAEAVAGWTLAFMFQVAHVVGDVEFLQADQKTGKVPRGWAAAQVATSADFAHGSWFWTHFSGGLNYQVVHHLFPGICHTYYRAIAPIVMATCQEFKIPYKVYPTFWSAVCAHFAHLKTMGSKGPYIPSLATVG